MHIVQCTCCYLCTVSQCFTEKAKACTFYTGGTVYILLTLSMYRCTMYDVLVDIYIPFLNVVQKLQQYVHVLEYRLHYQRNIHMSPK